MKARKPTILIVEDEKNLQDVYFSMLSENADCLVASSLDEMRELIDEADAVILDYFVQGASFDDLLLATKGKPALVVTGVLEPVFDRQLSKPFTPLELFGQIGSLLGELENGEWNEPGENRLPASAAVRCVLRPELGAGKIVRQIGDLPYFEVSFGDDCILKCHIRSLSAHDKAY